MKRLFKKVIFYIRGAFYSFFGGMKSSEDIILHSNVNDDGCNQSITQEVNSERISKALLRGEVTQEVGELRYRTYMVDKESKDFEYYAPTLAIRKDKQDNRFIKYDNSDGEALILSQENKPKVETVLETLKQVGGRGVKTEYTIHIKRGFTTPRYRLERYIKRLDIKGEEYGHDIIDIYVTKYFNPTDFTSKGFVKSIEKTLVDKKTPDFLEFKSIYFTTSGAYGEEDLTEVSITNLKYIETKEFDGNYIIRFSGDVVSKKVDLTKKYYSKTMDEKYKTNEKKDVALHLNDYLKKDTYKCEKCGKEVVLDYEMIDALECYQGRDITKEFDEKTNSDVTEFLDMQMSEQTFGTMMCSKCLQKYLEEYNLA